MQLNARQSRFDVAGKGIRGVIAPLGGLREKSQKIRFKVGGEGRWFGVGVELMFEEQPGIH